jgi:hypothetical protein
VHHVLTYTAVEICHPVSPHDEVESKATYAEEEDAYPYLYLHRALAHGGPHDEVESKATYAEEEDAYLYLHLALVHGGPHDEVESKATYAEEEDAYLYLDLALVHDDPHDGNYLTYLDQKAAVETDDLCPLSYAEISRWIENHLYFLLLLLG